MLEYLHGKSAVGPKTLFATHFHELIGMEEELKRMKNYHFAVQETKKEVVFLRKLIPGATDKSYGVHVARLAGIPKKVTERADVILSDTLSRDTSGGAKARRYTQLLLVDDSLPARTAPVQPLVLDPVVLELASLDPNSLTPMQALAKLAELKDRAGKSGTAPGEKNR